MQKIDFVDAKILSCLLKDANKSFADIAKETSLTKEAIAKRYQQMKQAGIIVGSTIQLDYKTFGYNAVADLLIKVQPQQLNQVIDYVRKIPNIYYVYPQNDIQHNLKIIVTLKDLKELERVKDSIKRHKAVMDLRSNIWTDIKNTPENLTIIYPSEKENSANIEDTIIFSNSQAKQKYIDELDLRIVEELANDSRKSFRKIAQTIGISTDTVARRYRNLVENGRVRAIIQINPKKLGYHAFACFKVAFTSQNNSLGIIDALIKIQDVTLIIKSSGDYDMNVFIMIKNIEQLLATQKEINQIPGITRLETKITEIYSPWPGPRQYISTF